jgi:hypothetical protein
MALDLRDCKFHGHALPEPFARGDLDVALADRKLLPKTTGAEGKALDGFWEVYRRKLRALPDSAGAVRVASHVIEPLLGELGYVRLRRDEDVVTREGLERGGLVLETADGGALLRAWTIDSGADFDAPQRRGQAYRYSPTQIAQRVLLAKGERVGLLTDGTELRILFCDPARRESHVSIELGRAGGWRGMRTVPDSFRLLLSLGRPAGVKAVPEIVEQARLQQTRVTDTLREQAQLAVRDFVQLLLDEPRNKVFFDRFSDRQDLAKRLFKDALVIVYRLLFILKLEASSDPERSFSFASTSLWRNSYSPTYALAPAVKLALDGGETGTFVSEGLRALFRMFREGFVWSEMRVTKLGGMLFGEGTAPILDGADLFWSERAAVKLLDHLLWTPRGKKGERQRVHYGPLYVEDLGRVYEALLELSPGIATEPMCRLRRQKLEVVVPAAQGEPYRKEAGAAASDAAIAESGAAAAGDDGEEEDGDEKPGKGKTKVEWIEAIREGAFYLRVGLGRKASGSYYTPQAFVKFLIQETLGPQIEARSPRDNPDPGALLGLKVLDPAMGSGHFLVEACRTLGDAIYEACRACDAKAEEADRRANGAETEEQRERFRGDVAAAGGGPAGPERRAGGLSAEPRDGGRGGGALAGQGAGDLPAARGRALPVWGGQERAGGGAGEAVIVAGVVRGGAAADVSGSSAALRGFVDRAVLREAPDVAVEGRRGAGGSVLAGADRAAHGDAGARACACARPGSLDREGRGGDRPQAGGEGEAGCGFEAVQAAVGGVERGRHARGRDG